MSDEEVFSEIMACVNELVEERGVQPLQAIGALHRAAFKGLYALADLSGAWIDRVHERRPPDGIILDMDSSESPTHGQQEGSAWNGHFGCTCYHPLFVFNQFGDLERCVLRPGNAHSAEGWRSVLEPVIARYRERGLPLWFRGDAAFAKPELHELLEAEEIGYAIRMPANSSTAPRTGQQRSGARTGLPTYSPGMSDVPLLECVAFAPQHLECGILAVAPEADVESLPP